MAEPSVFRIMDLIQGSIHAWADILKRVGVEALSNEFSGLDLEQKLDLDKRMTARSAGAPGTSSPARSR
jgi:hypothetical protein